MHASMFFCAPPGFAVIEWDGSGWRNLPVSDACVPILSQVTCVPATGAALPASQR